MHRPITHSLIAFFCSAVLLACTGSPGDGASKSVPLPNLDVTPDQFKFTDQADVALSAEITSAAVVISGINAPSNVSVINGTYSIDDSDFTAAAGTLNNGASVRVRHTSSATPGASVNTTLTVDGVSDVFTSTTTAPASADFTPDAFSFNRRTGVAKSTETISDATVITGMDAGTPVSVAGGSYSVNGGAFTTGDGTLASGDSVRLSHIAASTPNTDTVTTLTVGTQSGTYTSTTESAIAASPSFSLLPFVTSNGMLRLVDPEQPLVSNAHPNPKTVDDNLAPPTDCTPGNDCFDQATTFVAADLNGATLSHVREARLVYLKRAAGNTAGGPVFVVNLDRPAPQPGVQENVPKQISSLTDVCRIIKSETNDYLNVDNSAVVLERAGADGACGVPRQSTADPQLADNLVTVIRLNTSDMGPAGFGEDIPLVLEAGNPLQAQTNSMGAITGYISFEATPANPSPYSVVHRDANFSGPAFLLPMNQTTGANIARTDLTHLFVTAIAAGSGLALYRVNADGSGLSPQLYFFDHSPGNPIQGGLHDDANLYFAHDNMLLRMPLDSSPAPGTTDAVVMTTVASTLHIVGNRMLDVDGKQLVFEAQGVGGTPTTDAGVFSVPVTAINAPVTTLANAPDAKGGSARLVVATGHLAYINIINCGPAVEQSLVIFSAGASGGATLMDGYWAGSSRATTFDIAQVSSPPIRYVFQAFRVQTNNDTERTDSFIVRDLVETNRGMDLNGVTFTADGPAVRIHGFGPHVIAGVKRDRGFDSDVYLFDASGTAPTPPQAALTPDAPGNDIALGN